MTDTILGRAIATNKKITIPLKSRRNGMLVIGRTGSGKSTLLEQMAMQDIELGLGCCVIEPSGRLINSIIPRIPPSRYKDVILLYPEDETAHFGLNIYECPNITSRRMVSYTLNNVMDTFEKLYDMSRSTPRMAQVMRNVALTMIHNPGHTLIDVPLLLSPEKNHWFRRKLAANAPPAQKRFWDDYENMSFSDKRELVDSTRNKVDEFENDPLLSPIFGQSKTSIDFQNVINTGKILLVHLTAELPPLTDLLGAFTIGQLLIAALSRDPMKNHPQFSLFVDEFQRFLTPSMNTLLVESRKYSIATCVAHQVRDQLGEVQKATTLQANSLVVFAVTGRDAEELAKEFDATPNQADEREKTIPSDVLMHLSDHPNTFVKQFERQHGRKFLQAKAMRIQEKDYKTHPEGAGMTIYEVTRTETIYPKFIFDDAPITFDPNDLLKFLEVLETFLFDTMLFKKINMDQFNKEVLLWWAYCCSGMYFPTEKKREKKDYTRYLDPDYERRDQHDISERYERFKTALLRIAAILMYEPIKVFPSTRPDENTAQETFANMRARIENELVHLKIGQARIRIPDGEFTIETILPETMKEQRNKWESIRETLLDQTRRLYCKTAAEIEEEIRKRQTDGNPPTQRKHTM